MALYIVDIKGEIDGDYEIIRKYDERMSEDDAYKVLHDSGWLREHDKAIIDRVLAPYIGVPGTATKK